MRPFLNFHEKLTSLSMIIADKCSCLYHRINKWRLYKWHQPKADTFTNVIGQRLPIISTFANLLFSRAFFTIITLLGTTIVFPYLVYIYLDPPKDPEKVKKVTEYAYSVSFGWIVVMLIWVISLMVLHRRQQYLMGVNLHKVFHDIRDSYFKTKQKLIRKKHSVPELLIEFSMEACEDIAACFQHILNQKDIGCCIRLANKVNFENFDKNAFYVTVGRSRFLRTRSRDSDNKDKNNQNNTKEKEPPRLYAHEGLAAALVNERIEKGSTVVHIKNIPGVIKAKYPIWLEFPRDTKRTDIRSVLACPINCCEDDNIVMIGILYITSPNKGIFSRFNNLHVELEAGIADHLAPVLSDFMCQQSP